MAGANGTFYPPLSSTWKAAGSGLTAESFRQYASKAFNFLGSELQLYGMMHPGNPDDGPNSGWYGSTNGGGDNLEDIPEPTSIALWSLGALAGFAARRRRLRTA